MNSEENRQYERRKATPDKLRIIQRQLTVLVLALVALFLLFQVSAFFADILRIVAYSILLSYLFINVVDYLERFLKYRALAILLVYLFLATATVFGAIIIVPAIVYQISQLINTIFNQIPQAIQSLVVWLAPLETRLHAAQIQVRAIDILTNFASSFPKPDPSLVLGRMTDVAMSTMTWLVYALSIVVMSFYFLLDGHNIKEAIVQIFPHKHHASLSDLAKDIDIALQTFFRGQILLGLIFGALMILVFWIMGVHYALLLGIFLGACEIIPVIGPTIGFVPVIVSVIFHGMDNMLLFNHTWQVIVVFAVLTIVQWLKDNIVAPRYIGKVIGLHPILIFLAIMIGARLDGMSGIICSLPAACVINVLINRFASEIGKVHS